VIDLKEWSEYEDNAEDKMIMDKPGLGRMVRSDGRDSARGDYRKANQDVRERSGRLQAEPCIG
jgi:hypothetical protein